MKRLFFSLINRKLSIIFLNNENIVKELCEENYRMHSENFIPKIKDFFKSTKFSINEIEEIFFLTGPGSQVGERVSHSFAIGSLIGKPTIEIFSMDSLTFQRAHLVDCLSIVSVGERKRRYYVDICQKAKIPTRRENIDEEEVEEIRKLYAKLPVVLDFENINFLRNFLACREKFRAFDLVI